MKTTSKPSGIKQPDECKPAWFKKMKVLSRSITRAL